MYTIIYYLLAVLINLTASIAMAQQNNDLGRAKEIISDLDSIVAPGGVQESYQVLVGGENQWVYVRGQDKVNPIILFIHGGPASPMAPLSWAFQRPMEEYFTVVQYDQRASGKTYRSNDTLGLGKTIRIDQYSDDAIEIAEQIKKRYHKQKIILMGHSWGTIVAMEAVLKKPELFYAYVGVGQVINAKENERISFEYAMHEAEEHHNDKALAELESIAPYPGDRPITRERVIKARRWAQYYGGLSAFRDSFDYYFNVPKLSPYYTEKDVKAINEGSVFTLGRLLPAFLNVDFTEVTEFPVPVFMFMGRHDQTTPTAPTAKWLDNVDAPLKKGIWFEHSAHLVMLEEPGKMLVTLLNEVRPLTKENK